MAEVVTGKRLKISNLRKQMMVAVLLASLVLGVCGVLAIFLIKYINFNARVIGEKDLSISNYDSSIKNAGLCEDGNRNGKIDDNELKQCNPEATNITMLEGTLRYNVLSKMAKNKNLESVGRDSLKECVDESGKRINFERRYREAQDNDMKAYNLSMLKMCSALRAIPDALPAQRNDEALMSSLNQIFIQSNWEPESLSPGASDGGEDETSDLSTIPVSLTVEADSATTRRVLSNLERSIRAFNVSTATISWSGGNLELKAEANSYYTKAKSLAENKKTVYASKAAEKKATNSGGSR